MTPDEPRPNHFWEIIWADGRREIVEARSLSQGGADPWGAKAENEYWALYREGQGLVWTAKKRLVESIRCLDPEESTA
jgi:hypothetical protein